MRALGPSLGTGFVSDPTMSLKDDENNSLSENDDWQSGSQAASISGQDFLQLMNTVLNLR